MGTYILISVISGILFAVLDTLINANPYAQKLYRVYTPIARKSANIFAGVAVDLIFGFLMAGIFLVLYQGLPGESGLVKGLLFAVLMWIFRVVMYAASQWMMFIVPIKTLLYNVIAGLGEMAILGLLYGLVLKPIF